MRTLGSQIVPARVNELRHVLQDLEAEDLAQLDPTLGIAMRRPFGREVLSITLPLLESVYVCLHNIEPAGLIVLHRGRFAARIRALAVSPDLRRKGLARTLLTAAEERVQVRQVEWLWMYLPSVNIPATQFALKRGFRRYRPQYLTRGLGRSILATTHDVRVHRVHGAEAERRINHWLGVEVTAGDAWIQPLVEKELARDLLPGSGETWLLYAGDSEIGCAHVTGSGLHPTIEFWMDDAIWNTPTEMMLLKAILNTEPEIPSELDVRFGSEGHLKASVEAFKQLGFVPRLHERVMFVKQIAPPEDL